MDFPITNSYFQEAARTAADAKRLLVLANRILANEDVCDAYGHVSIRNPENPETFFISRAIYPSSVTVDDIMEMDLDNQIVAGKNGWRPFSESVIHTAIYAVRKDVNCVCHTHPPELIAFSSTDVPLRSVYHQDVTFYDGVPVFKEIPEESGLLIKEMDVAGRLAAMLDNKRGILIRNHGVVTVGESAPRAVYSSITMRDNARIYFYAAALSKQLHYISREESMHGTRNQFCGHSLERSWNYWCNRAKAACPDIVMLVNS